MASKTRLLFVDDQIIWRETFLKIMRNEQEFDVDVASNGQEALDKLAMHPSDIVITDILMPVMDGFELIGNIKSLYPDIFVLMVTGDGSIDSAVQAMKLGAYDYIVKPFNFEKVRQALQTVVDHKKLIENNYVDPEGRIEEPRFENIIGQDPKMFAICDMIARVAKTEASVLITGESGTGKELVAEAIHRKSPRADKSFVPVNCAALTETLINSELFGYEKGAFTGANNQTKGHFEVADGGSIFLDEIGDVPVQTQVSLLRVLEQGCFQRVGGTQTIKIDVRVISATNQNLALAIQEKRFREDLYYRLNVITIEVSPLRERKSDIPILSKFFLKRHFLKINKRVPRLSVDAMMVLTKYDWPGNVRELANAMAHAAVFSKGDVITVEDLPKELTKRKDRDDGRTIHLPSRSLRVAEEILIKQVLEESNWNLKQAARELDIARGTLYSKMKKYGLRPKGPNPKPSFVL